MVVDESKESVPRKWICTGGWQLSRCFIVGAPGEIVVSGEGEEEDDHSNDQSFIQSSLGVFGQTLVP